MFTKERQHIIEDMPQKNGVVTTSELVTYFGVSIETIRKDLLSMEQEGQLSRVHGGAVVKSDMKPFPELQQRNQEHSEQKAELSLKAIEFISNGDIIGIDSGSTAISLAEVVKDNFSKLTVVTHSLDVFNLLCNHEYFSLILCGGHYMRRENAFYGPLTLDTINNLHIQKSFIFPTAISFDGGIFDYEAELCQIQRQMMKSSDDIYILADSSKFEKRRYLRLMT